MALKFLLVEDDPEIREIITDYFSDKSDEAYTIDSAKSGKEGQEKCLEKDYDLVLS